MRHTFRLALAATVAGALTVATVAPAGAQEEPAALGFAVDKTQAQPGALVLGKADAGDVAEHCTTELEAFQARFGELVERLAFFVDGERNPFLDRFFPEDVQNLFEVENHDQLAYTLLLFVALGLQGFTGPEPAEQALPQTFVMTFADIATQAPVGERGNFDPDTGDGSVVVPDIEPGLWAVAAACVGPIVEDLDALEAGIRQGGAFLQEIGVPEPDGDLVGPEIVAFMQEFLSSEATGLELIIEFVTAIGPDLLEPIMVPDAFGAVLFCILDDQGNCPSDEEPPPPGLDEEDTKDMAPPADAVVAAPSFTG
ncbi:MAG TPA: hypothetical protein VFZ68_18385 [Acidimicrobiales bacterium]